MGCCELGNACPNSREHSTNATFFESFLSFSFLFSSFLLFIYVCVRSEKGSQVKLRENSIAAHPMDDLNGLC